MRTPRLPKKPKDGFSIEYWELVTWLGVPIIHRRAVVWVQGRGWKAFVNGKDLGLLNQDWDDPLKWPSWIKYYSSYASARKAALKHCRDRLEYFREKVAEIEQARILLLRTRP